MTGYYIYCRVWVGFSFTFPYFDELNPLPDDQLITTINDRARQWLRENRPTVRKRYRDEAIALANLRREVQKWQRYSTPCGIPNMSSYDKAMINQTLRLSKRSELLEEAERYGVQLALSDEELRTGILDAMEKEHLQREFAKRRGEHQLYTEQERDQLILKKRVRGDKKQTSLETRAAKIAGWTTQNIGRFGYFSMPPAKDLTCAVSPTPKLMLLWLSSGERVDEFVRVAHARFQRYDWRDLPIKFGILSCATLGSDEVTMIEQQKREDLDPESKWTGTPLYRAIKNDFDLAIQNLEAVLQREKNKDLKPVVPHGSGTEAKTAASIIAKTRREWFTVYELAQESGLSEDSIEGRIRRWADKEEIPEGSYRFELPEASSGVARYMYRLELVWPLLGK